MASQSSCCGRLQLASGGVLRSSHRAGRPAVHTGQLGHTLNTRGPEKLPHTRPTGRPQAGWNEEGESSSPAKSLKEKYAQKRREILAKPTWPLEHKEIFIRLMDRCESQGKDFFSIGGGDMLNLILEQGYVEYSTYTGEKPDMYFFEVVKTGSLYWAGLSLAMPAVICYTSTLGAHVPWAVMEPVTWGLYLGMLTRWSTLCYLPTFLSTLVISKVQNQSQPKVCSDPQLVSEVEGIGKLVAHTLVLPMLFHWTDGSGAMLLTEGLMAGWVLAELCRLGGMLLAGAGLLMEE